VTAAAHPRTPVYLDYQATTPADPQVVEAMLPWLPDAEQAPPDDLVERARAADLYWIVEAASRRGQGPTTDRAFEHLVAMADGESLLAEPAAHL